MGNVFLISEVFTFVWKKNYVIHLKTLCNTTKSRKG